MNIVKYDNVAKDSKGVWVDGMDTTCSQCGFTCNDNYYLGSMVACPNCGARMVGLIECKAVKVQDMITALKENHTVEAWLLLGYPYDIATELNHISCSII